MASARIIVERPVARAFAEALTARTQRVFLGDLRDPRTMYGPLINVRALQKVDGQVQEAIEAGVEVMTGGKVIEGLLYAPTVLFEPHRDAAVWNEETFGPVVALTPFDGDEETAVRLANETLFGLGANVYTADVDRGLRVARRIRSGQVGINRYLGGAAGAPWVGARQSGFGFLGGIEGHRQFTVPKSISMPRTVPAE